MLQFSGRDELQTGLFRTLVRESVNVHVKETGSTSREEGTANSSGGDDRRFFTVLNISDSGIIWCKKIRPIFRLTKIALALTKEG